MLTKQQLRAACTSAHTCMVKVQTTISPRRKRSALLDSARSEALEDARGYSPADAAQREPCKARTCSGCAADGTQQR